MAQKNGTSKTAHVGVDMQKAKSRKEEVKLPALAPLSPSKKSKEAPMPSKPAPASNGAKTTKAPTPKSPVKSTARNTPTKLAAPVKPQSLQPTALQTKDEHDFIGTCCASDDIPSAESSDRPPTAESRQPASTEIMEPSISAGDLAAAVVEPCSNVIAATDAAAAGEETERLRKLNGNGMVKLIYESYDELFPIDNGSTTQANIDEVYCLSFVMPNCLVRLSRHPNPERFRREESGIFDSLVREDPRGTYQDLEKDQMYYVVVEQEADQLRRDQEATKALWDGELQKQKSADKNDGRGFESCSCIYGNPCVDEYGCRDWHSRFAIATNNGWKGF